ncbi:hypothetical protein CBR_g30843 [Chara braunii]|uniref:Flotillin-like n=1 Tax=Chara braunii TaxID=69332 RepID=A0A388JXK4_CHABU|nr:hypothetical protein CBR_g30843 [Chara braunii]|eukprot:GBG62526.1 hypothetical protein CBR_g30843 [Chara braunii]
MLYRVASPNQYLVRTGWGIKDVRVTKKGWVWPGQRGVFFDMTPANYTLSLQAMTMEKLEFLTPAVFTIGPHDEPEALKRYSKLLALQDRGGADNHVSELVKGVIEGETRVLAASMTMEEIFNQRKLFKETVTRNIQLELDQFGLFIYNANIKQLQDTPGSEYFQYMRSKTHEGAVNQAKVDVAEARYRGDVGEKERSALTRQQVHRIEAETVSFENEKKREMAESEASLLVQKADYSRRVEIARVEAQQAKAIRETELQRQVEERRQLAETERLRAEMVSKAIAERESVMQKSDASLYKEQKAAEAALYAKVKEAEGALLEMQKRADGSLYSQQKQAEGLYLIAKAQADGMRELISAFNGDISATLQYVMIEKRMFQELAAANAKAIQGLNPKITVWTTGGTGTDGKAEGSASLKPIHDIFQSLPPLFSTIQEQTGIEPPKWVASMAPNAGPYAVSN